MYFSFARNSFCFEFKIGQNCAIPTAPKKSGPVIFDKCKTNKNKKKTLKGKRKLRWNADCEQSVKRDGKPIVFQKKSYGDLFFIETSSENVQ